MSDRFVSDERTQRPDIILDPSQYSGDVLFYPRENRIDINVCSNTSIEKGNYHPNINGPLYLCISPSPQLDEVREQIVQRGLDNEPRFEAITGVYEDNVPKELSFMVSINTSGSIIPRRFDHQCGFLPRLLKFGFNKAKSGAYFESELTDDQALFVLALIRDSFTYVLGKARSGAPEPDKPPRIRRDPLRNTLTDEQFEQEVLSKYRNPQYVEKIRKQREQIIAQLKYMETNAREIIDKSGGRP